jgi:hypothetical protein
LNSFAGRRVGDVDGLAAVGIGPLAVDVALLAKQAGVLERQSGWLLERGLRHDF